MIDMSAKPVEWYTIDDLLYFLRNGNNCEPFLDPEDILKADPELEVNYNVGGDQEVNVYDPRNNFHVFAPLDEQGEIVWESWEVIPNASQD